MGLDPYKSWRRATYLDNTLLSQLVLAIWSHWVKDDTVMSRSQSGDGYDPQHLLMDIWHMGFCVLDRY